MNENATTSNYPCVVCDGQTSATFIRADPYSIRRCSTCGVRFLCPQPSHTDLEALYSHEYFVSPDCRQCGYSEYLSDASNHRLTFRNRLKYLPKPVQSSRLLDVGAATGFFVEQARLNGWEAVGIEPSTWASEYARSVLGQPVVTGTLSEASFAYGSFDLVTMWEVIEHLPNPRATVQGLASLLKPGGYLALTTPDAGSLVARLAGHRWLGWRKVPEHLFFFDRHTLTRLLSSAGFEVVEYRYVSIFVDAQFALTRLLTLIGLRDRRLPAFLGNRSMAVNPFYDLFVLAKLAEPGVRRS